MSTPVAKIDRIRGTGPGKGGNRPAKGEKNSGRHAHETDDDSVSISNEARQKASGKKKQTIIEYLEEGE